MPSVWKKLYIICIFVIVFKQGDSQNLRLKEGRASSRGRLEVKHNGEWGTVCSKNFNQNAATIACAELGFASVFKASRSLSYPRGPTGGRIWLDNVQCSGNESSLFDCDHNDWGDISGCSHEDDVAIECHNNQGTVALSEDVSSQNDFVTGRIQVLYNTDFGYIHSSNGWDYDDVKVVCRQLGYYTGGNYSTCSACDYTPCDGSHSYSWDVSIDCDGDEEHLLDCTNASSWMSYRGECTDPYVAASVSCAVPKQGGWSTWTPVGQCSSSCSDGIQKFTRTCSRPTPEFGGENCVGNSTYVASCKSPSCGNDSNEQLWKIVVLAAGPAAVVGFTAGLIVLLAILIRNRRKLKHLCYGGEQLPGEQLQGGQHVQEERPLVQSGNGGPDGGDN